MDAMSSIQNAREQPLGRPAARLPKAFLLRQSPLGPSIIGAELAARLRLLARIWTIVALIGFGGSIYFRGVPFNEYGSSWQQPVQIALLGIAGLGWLATWKSEWLGASLLLIGASGLGLLAAIQYQPLASFVPFFVLLVPAVLHWLCWQRWQPTYILVLLAAVLTATISGGAVAADRVHANYFGPTHQASETALAPADRVNWAWSGAVETDSIVVKAQILGEPSSTRLAISRHSNLDGVEYFDGMRTLDTGYQIYAYPVSGLEPDTAYFYAVEVDGQLDTARSGRFRTLPEGPTSFSFVYGSCALTGSNGTVFDIMRESDPLFLLHGGDFHYGNIEENDPDAFISEMTESLTAPAQSALYRSVPIAYVWDDHDYGANNSDSQSPSREASLTAYSAAVPHYDFQAPPEGDGIYQAFTVGRARFILTDLRSHRDPASTPDGPDKSMMGAEQKAWFKAQLLEAKGRYPVIFWVSGVPWITEAVEGEDHWGGYTHERAELAEFIAENDIDGLIMLSGDAHMVALDDGTNSNYASAPGPGFPVFHASAFDRVGSTKGGPYSHGTYPGGGHYGQITVTDLGAKQIRVEMTGRTWEGEVLVTYTVEINAPFALER